VANEDSNFYQGHRARLRQKFLDDQIAEYEKLELLLGYAIPRRDVRPLARALINKYGSLGQLLTMPYEELIKFPGVGHNVAVFLKSIHSVVMDGYKTVMGTEPIFHDNEMLNNYCKWIVANKIVEEFHILYFDSEYRLIKDELHSVGTYDSSGVYAREIVKRALALNSTILVFVHNHPTTNQGFSTQDIETTKELQRILSGLGIKLYDHIVVTKYSVFSARNTAWFHC